MELKFIKSLFPHFFPTELSKDEKMRGGETKSSRAAQGIWGANNSGSSAKNDDLSLLKLQALVDRPLTTSTQFKELYDYVTTIDFNTPEQAYVYNLLEKKFRSIEWSQSSQAWAQRADLLDAVDAFVKKYPDFSPLSINDQPASSTTWKEGAVPLVPYAKMKQATKKLNDLATGALKTAGDVQKNLPNEAICEKTNASATIIHRLTRRHLIGASLLEGFYRLITRLLGVFYNQPAFFGSQLDQIRQFSQDMGIQPIEILSKISLVENKKTEQFYYRGPRYLFGQSLYEYKTVNDWFKRDLTDEARQVYLNSVHYKESKLDARYGKSEDGASRVVISNSDCRLRFNEIQSGQLGNLQELTGKVLNQEAENQAKAKRDDPAYYANRYKFSSKNLLGREAEDSMSPKALDKSRIQAFNNDLEPFRSIETSKLQTIEKRKQSALKKTDTQKLIKQAQHELLGGMYRAFDSEGSVQVIQRLAPADIHNYVASVNGKPLSNSEAVVFLKQRLMEKQSYLVDKNSLTLTQKEEIDKELKVFEELESVFKGQELLLGRASQATIDIHGTNSSVSTSAIRNQSRILAQNDRKIMLFKHEDNSFSLHAFIGATGVNRVDVDPATSSKKQGDRQGDMQFGPDRYRQKGLFQAASDATTKDGLNKLSIGERQGNFPMNGSTVVSYYLSADFSLLPKAQRYKEKAVYGEGANRCEIETQAKMGDPLLVKTEIALVDFLEKRFPDCFKPDASVDKIISEIPQLKLTAENKPIDAIEQKTLDLLQKLFSEAPLTFEENKLKQRSYDLLEKRLIKMKSD